MLHGVQLWVALPDHARNLEPAFEHVVPTEAVDGGLPFSVSGSSLAGVRMLNLVTPLGELDLTFAPAGTGGFEDLDRSASVHAVGGVQVRVAALADVIRSKCSICSMRARWTETGRSLPNSRIIAASSPGSSRSLRQ